MPDEDRSLLLKILEAVARLETEVKAIKGVSDTANEARDIAKEALQSTRSAHKRLDAMEDEFEKLKDSVKDSEKESHSKWEHVWERAFWAISSVLVYIALGHFFHF
ncbi:hypothetical protein LSG31_00260 [Fodinisporobacter ferrooxydans]|uniref:Uncharacterized protein n=1 Tax=Fodinisporobacter ferrooxydans TaxID=2901836 RepID=A0ABY4CS99_9BACL|nr:hypothetical protein LSG31_00260 [Alicyclobacillaceae bacterium MYW30-H2]